MPSWQVKCPTSASDDVFPLVGIRKEISGATEKASAPSTSARAEVLALAFVTALVHNTRDALHERLEDVPGRQKCQALERETVNL